MIERIKSSADLIELAQVVPLIQNALLSENDKRNLRIIFDNKKVELAK